MSFKSVGFYIKKQYCMNKWTIVVAYSGRCMPVLYKGNRPTLQNKNSIYVYARTFFNVLRIVISSCS